MKNPIRIALIYFLLGGIISVHAQTKTMDGTRIQNARQQVIKQANVHILDSLALVWQAQAEKERIIAHQVAKEKGWSILQEDSKGNIIELVRLDETGGPVYYTTDNLNAARTISTDEVWAGGTAGTSLSGSGMTIGIWEGGGVRLTHQELSGSATQIDVPTNPLSDHATHVAGTMVGDGVNPIAKGMAYQASIDCYDWNSDQSEMATAAAAGLLISNHSYGRIRGWGSGNIPNWYGNLSVDSTQDYQFGFYGSLTREWDILANNAPHYLIVKSAGNDRNDAHTGSHYVSINGSWTLSTDFREPDGGTDGYDCIGLRGVAKNILTVGAVSDIPGGYTSPSDVNMSSFSGWGPTDDGRIKPDIVANGISLLSSSSAGNTSYNTKSGTSMATPNVSGSLLLLQEHYANLNAVFMRSATLKALALHTADEAGPADGPDYQHGWGLMNTEKAVRHITNASDTSGRDLILEESLSDGETYTFAHIYSDGSTPIRVTLAWTDPAAAANSQALNPTTSNLVNDLDLRIIGNSTHLPYILDPANPSAAATTGDNVRDNVEQVYMASPTIGFYSVQVNHKGTLSPLQDFSLVISGGDTTSPITFLSPISCGDSVSGTTLGASTNFDFYSCVSWDETGPEDIYPLTLVSTREITASLSGLSAGDNLDVFLLSDNGSCLEFADSTLTYTADPGNYYVVVDGYLGDSGPYSLDISCAIPACTITPISCGDTIHGNTAGASYINNEYGCIPWNETGPEVVYELTLVSTGAITASLSNLSVDLDVFLMSTCDTDSASCLAYSTDSLTYSNAAPGTYYIIVDGNNGAEGSFTLDVQVLPAITLPSLTSVCEDDPPMQLTASPAGGSYSGPGIINNTFIPFVAGIGTHTLTYTIADTNGCVSTATEDIIVNAPPDQPEVEVLGNVLSASVSSDSYQWYIDGMILIDSISQTIVASDSGSYQVEVVDENGCSSRSDILMFQPVGVGIDRMFPHASLSLYPNPSEGVVFVSVENLPAHEGLEISIHDMHGRRIIQERWMQHGTYVNSLDLRSHVKSIYLIRMSYLGVVIFERKLMLR